MSLWPPTSRCLCKVGLFLLCFPLRRCHSRSSTVQMFSGCYMEGLQRRVLPFATQPLHPGYSSILEKLHQTHDGSFPQIVLRIVDTSWTLGRAPWSSGASTSSFCFTKIAEESPEGCVIYLRQLGAVPKAGVCFPRVFLEEDQRIIGIWETRHKKPYPPPTRKNRNIHNRYFCCAFAVSSKVSRTADIETSKTAAEDDENVANRRDIPTLGINVALMGSYFLKKFWERVKAGSMWWQILALLS